MEMGEGSRWLSYDDMATALRITPDSARRLVARRKWARQQGNDGRTLVAVPLDRLPPDDAPGAGEGATPIIPPDISPAVTPDTPSPVQVLQARVTELEAELRIERERSAGLAAVSEAERRHAAEIRADRDAWRAQVERLATPAPHPPRSAWWPWRRTG